MSSGRLTIRSSEDAALGVGLVAKHAFVTQPGEVDRAVLAVHDALGDRTPCRRSVHHAMSREAGAGVEVVEHARPVADDRIAVELALLVESRPAALAARRFERREAMRDGR